MKQVMKRLRGSTCMMLAPLAVALLAVGCVWRTIEEQHQLEEQSFVRPVGKTAGTTIILKGKRTYKFSISEARDQHGDRYRVAPDTYRATVRRGDRVVVDRKLFIADGETRELRVPGN